MLNNYVSNIMRKKFWHSSNQVECPT